MCLLSQKAFSSTGINLHQEYKTLSYVGLQSRLESANGCLLNRGTRRLRPLHCINPLTDPWQRIGILYCKVVSISIVNTHSIRAVFVRHHDYGTADKTLTRYSHTFSSISWIFFELLRVYVEQFFFVRTKF